MTDELKAACAKLWNGMTVSVDRFHAQIVVHPKSLFLGYADITFGVTDEILPGLQFKVRGVEVKILKGNHNIGFYSEKGGDGVWYPQVFPKTPELREVLTAAIFSDQRIMDTIEAAANLPVEPATDADEAGAAPAAASASNPFS